MSAFSEQLRVALEAADLSQSDFAEITRISQSTISRYLKGEIKPEPEVFGQLLNGLPESLHFEVILARLTDELPKEYRSTVTILAQGGTVREDSLPYLPQRMAKDLRRAFEYLAKTAIEEPELRNLIITLARAFGIDHTKE
jgi:transcriptional regulator with XRE-family HTH domain